jgi:hypothetical protein
MRASEEMRQHTEIARQLNAVVEARWQELRTLVGEDTYAKVLESGLPVVAKLGGPVEAAYTAAIRAERAYKAHQLQQPNTVRNYRVLSLEDNRTLLEFTDDRSIASTRAYKEVAVAMGIPSYSLEEQVDGEWKPFYKEHEGL